MIPKHIRYNYNQTAPVDRKRRVIRFDYTT